MATSAPTHFPSEVDTEHPRTKAVPAFQETSVTCPTPTGPNSCCAKGRSAGEGGVAVVKELMSEPSCALDPEAPAQLHAVQVSEPSLQGFSGSFQCPQQGYCSLAFSGLGQRRAGRDGEV